MSDIENERQRKPRQAKRERENVVMVGGLSFNRDDYKPLNGANLTLSADGLDLHPDLHYCWVNEPNVDEYRQGGYQTVPDVARRYVGRTMHSAQTYAVLMAIPNKWHVEEQLKKEEEAKEKSNQNKLDAYNSVEDSYIPDLPKGFKPKSI